MTPAEQCAAMMNGMGGMMNGMGGMMMWPILGTLLIGGLFLLGVALIVRLLWKQANGNTAATRLLEERFARGEIDQEEYTARLRTLQGAVSTVPRS